MMSLEIDYKREEYIMAEAGASYPIILSRSHLGLMEKGIYLYQKDMQGYLICLIEMVQLMVKIYLV